MQKSDKACAHIVSWASFLFNPFFADYLLATRICPACFRWVRLLFMFTNQQGQWHQLHRTVSLFVIGMNVIVQGTMSIFGMNRGAMYVVHGTWVVDFDQKLTPPAPVQQRVHRILKIESKANHRKSPQSNQSTLTFTDCPCPPPFSPILPCAPHTLWCLFKRTGCVRTSWPQKLAIPPILKANGPIECQIDKSMRQKTQT